MRFWFYLAVVLFISSLFVWSAFSGPTSQPVVTSEADLKQWTQALLNSANAAGLKVVRIQWTRTDGTSDSVTMPLPATLPSTGPATVPVVVPPPVPSNVVAIGPHQKYKTLDEVDLNTSGKVYWLERGAVIQVQKKQTVNTPGVTICSAPGSGPPAVLQATGAAWKEQQLNFGPSADNCAVADLVVQGADGVDVFRLDGASGFKMTGVSNRVGPDGGCGLLLMFGVDGVQVSNCSTVRTGRYSAYAGGVAPNRNITFVHCSFGPSMLNDPNSSRISEHCFRCYSVQNLLLDTCVLDNSTNTDGKQAVKIMSGDGVKISNCTFKGSTRFGRDVNDPPINTLRNVTISKSSFTDWVRCDPGASLSMSDSMVIGHSGGFAFSVVQDGRLRLARVVASYPGGQFANSPGKIDTSAGGNSFNGQSVP